MKYFSSLGGVFILVLIFILVWYINPQQHFSKNIPILASPTGEVKDANTPTVEYQEFNILLLGIDARGQEASRTDAIMLASVNLREGKIDLLSIPRDTRVYIEGVGYTKISHAHFLGEVKGGNQAGTRETIKAVSELCGCDINYYIKVDFKGFEDFVDNLGGIDLVLSQPVKLTYSNITLPAAKQQLTGSTALCLARERVSLPDGDFGRQRNQALVLKAITQKVIEPQNLERLPSLVRQFKREVIDMNLSEGDLISLAWLLKDVSKDQIYYSQIPGRDGYAIDPLLNMELYYWIPEIT